jgi:hypothetical protein
MLLRRLEDVDVCALQLHFVEELQHNCVDGECHGHGTMFTFVWTKILNHCRNEWFEVGEERCPHRQS